MLSPRFQFPTPGVPFDVRPRARTIIWPMTVWAAEPQWDSKDKCRSIDNQIELTAGVQQIHTYIYCNNDKRTSTMAH